MVERPLLGLSIIVYGWLVQIIVFFLSFSNENILDFIYCYVFVLFLVTSSKGDVPYEFRVYVFIYRSARNIQILCLQFLFRV